MFQDLRREKILDLIKENGNCTVVELSRIFDVTQPTIRQDLEALEKTGAIKRQHGGAFINNYSSFATELQPSHRDHIDEKRSIALKASEFIKSGDSIILDSGSTITELAKCLSDRTDLKIKQAMINCAKEIYLLCDSSKFEKILFASLGCLEKINYLITDKGANPSFLEETSKLGIKVITC